MSDAPREARSFEIIGDEDLRRLAIIGADAIAHVCRPFNKSHVYADRLRVLCFCQGAALHHQQCSAGVATEDQRGIHDFDVWGFLELIPGRRFVSRKPWERDFGPSRFGKSPNDAKRKGRKVDVLGRAIDFLPDEPVSDAVLRWLTGPGDSPAALRMRPVYIISPGPDFGRMIWSGQP
ncbi:hypothetical protein [Methylobacterium sp. J-070]|uniref:hypothetical protein n=1 Tax=Methylobacterium sp. J-070 TaxID=2836650 RepID=UPI001FB9022C|nr:hypothetical protein [Methylobacterium sp. J-070]MCJ2052867.1 hypothetical protein [Methylobacterium sp. J-070]